jgi:hypothetical protein
MWKTQMFNSFSLGHFLKSLADENEMMTDIQTAFVVSLPHSTLSSVERIKSMPEVNETSQTDMKKENENKRYNEIEMESEKWNGEEGKLNKNLIKTFCIQFSFIFLASFTRLHGFSQRHTIKFGRLYGNLFA